MGGLYNMLAGWNPACLWLAPMLTEENPQTFFPRFRDCYLSDEGDTIVIFTRVGGGNRSNGPDDESMARFLKDLEDVFERERELSRQHAERILEDTRAKVERMKELVGDDSSCQMCKADSIRM